ncbi:septum formation initiator family protein [Siminovitchia sediminis]|uniref:Septum formation initiator family protein n=1 Tax=Siminovitchia sediminis TaxID=1274353 RepID=A0ABW4KHJ7_9BACI
MGAKPGRTVTTLENNYTIEQEIAARSAARRKKLLIRRLSVFFVFSLLVCTLLISTLVSREAALKAKETEKAKAEERLTELEKQQLRLENEIVKLNDDEYIAKLARSEYFLSDKGEIIFNIPKEKEKEKKEEKEKD